MRWSAMKLATVCNDVRMAGETERQRDTVGEWRIKWLWDGYVYIKFTVGTCVEIKNTGQN